MSVLAQVKRMSVLALSQKNVFTRLLKPHDRRIASTSLACLSPLPR